MKPGILYLIPNTLGGDQTNMSLAEIIPEKVGKTTAALDYFIAENAKSARAHLKRISEKFPLQFPLQQIDIAELNVRTDKTILPQLLAPILTGKNAGLISEAGVPAVADPGADLVKLAHELDITVKPLVGPSSLLLALMASGLNGQSFAFNGYLPTDSAERNRRIKILEEQSRKNKQTQMFIETPYRNEILLKALCMACHPATQLCIATDITLSTESVKTLSITKWNQHLENRQIPNFQKKPTFFLFLAN